MYLREYGGSLSEGIEIYTGMVKQYASCLTIRKSRCQRIWKLADGPIRVEMEAADRREVDACTRSQMQSTPLSTVVEASRLQSRHSVASQGFAASSLNKKILKVMYGRAPSSPSPSRRGQACARNAYRTGDTSLRRRCTDGFRPSNGYRPNPRWTARNRTNIASSRSVTLPPCSQPNWEVECERRTFEEMT